MVDDEQEPTSPQVRSPRADALEGREQLDLGDGIVALVLSKAAPVVGDYPLVAFVVLLGEDSTKAFGLGGVRLDDHLAVEAGHAEDDRLGGHVVDESGDRVLDGGFLALGRYIDSGFGEVCERSRYGGEPLDETAVVGTESHKGANSLESVNGSGLDV